MLQLAGSRYVNNIIMALMRQESLSTIGHCCICDSRPGNHRISGVRTRATVASEKPNHRGSHCGDKRKKTKGFWPDLIHKLGYWYGEFEGGERFCGNRIGDTVDCLAKRRSWTADAKEHFLLADGYFSPANCHGIKNSIAC